MDNNDRADLYSQNISGVYITLVSVSCGNTKFYLNDGGVEFTFQGHVYTPAAFTVSEPASTEEEGNGSFTIAGVPQEYIELVQEADPREDVISVTVGAGKLIYTNNTPSIEGDQYLLEPLDYDVDSVVINSASAALTLNMHTGGIFGFYASSKQFSPSTFPALYG